MIGTMPDIQERKRQLNANMRDMCYVEEHAFFKLHLLVTCETACFGDRVFEALAPDMGVKFVVCLSIRLVVSRISSDRVLHVRHECRLASLSEESSMPRLF